MLELWDACTVLLCGCVLLAVIVIRSMCQFVGRETKYEYVSPPSVSLPSVLSCYSSSSSSSSSSSRTYRLMWHKLQ